VYLSRVALQVVVPTYSELMAAQAAAPSPDNAFAADLFERLPKRYDVLAELLSFGQNARWRRDLVDHIAEARPGRILDVATGTAGVAIELARRTGAEVIGVDISEAMLRRGRERVSAAGLERRVSLEIGRAEALRFESESFDAVSFTYVLRYVGDPEATLRELCRVLRPGGVMASLDFFVPPNPAWLAAWRCYTRAVLPAMGWLAGGSAWARVGRFLGPNIEGHYSRRPLPRLVEAWAAAGMGGVGRRVMSLGGGLVMWGTKA
jgi:demethylmenaquinone methyltransferase / 2-methoxy-6-polyprenyl-1,4-benzoquinol methylase